MKKPQRKYFCFDASLTHDSAALSCHYASILVWLVYVYTQQKAKRPSCFHDCELRWSE